MVIDLLHKVGMRNLYEHISNESLLYFRIMPRSAFTAEFLVGYIQAKLEQLRSIVYRMESRRNFSAQELGYIRKEILDIDLEIQTQSKLVKDERINPKVKEYVALLDMAEKLWEKREGECGACGGVVKQPIAASIQFSLAKWTCRNMRTLLNPLQ